MFKIIFPVIALSIFSMTTFPGCTLASAVTTTTVAGFVPSVSRRMDTNNSNRSRMRRKNNIIHHPSPKDLCLLPPSLSLDLSTSLLSSSLSSSSTTSLANSFQDGTIEVTREFEVETSTKISSSHSLHYRIHNRMNLSSLKAAPVLILHGGPGVPSDYLYPLKDVIPYRSLIFYDQLGSGRSPGPGSDQTSVDATIDDESDDSDDDSDVEEDGSETSNASTNDEQLDYLDAYSIEKSIDDLELLIKKLNLRRFHLYGQSFGGILAFEYIKRMAEQNQEEQPECLSVILSSSPCDVKQVESSANALIETLLEEDDDTSTLPERFRLQNQCRIPEKPQPLVDAYNHAGTIWRGTDVIKDWKAEHPKDGSKRMPSAMVMRGEHDFVSQECIEGWKKVFNHPFVRLKVLDACSHHGLLENGQEYGEIVDSFFAEYD